MRKRQNRLAQLRTGATVALFGIGLAAASASPAAAATFPYTNDFGGAGANTDFPNEGGGTTPWNVSGGTYNVADSNITGQVNTTASIPVTGRPTVAGQGFVQSTQFTVNSVTGTPNFLTFGFATLSSVAAPYTSSNYYLSDLSFADDTAELGRLRILTQGTSNADFVQGSNNDAVDPSALAVGTTYTLRLTGTYDGTGGLSMTLQLLDATGTTQIGSSVAASDPTPWAGDNFGYRNAGARVGTAMMSYNVSFDNFQVVPEPGTAAAVAGLALACGAVGRRRRRARAH